MKAAQNHGLVSLNPNFEPIAYSIADAVRASSICRTSLYRLIKEGKLEARKVGKRTLIPAASLRALVEGQA